MDNCAPNIPKEELDRYGKFIESSTQTPNLQDLLNQLADIQAKVIQIQQNNNIN